MIDFLLFKQYQKKPHMVNIDLLKNAQEWRGGVEME